MGLVKARSLSGCKSGNMDPFESIRGEVESAKDHYFSMVITDNQDELQVEGLQVESRVSSEGCKGVTFTMNIIIIVVVIVVIIIIVLVVLCFMKAVKEIPVEDAPEVSAPVEANKESAAAAEPNPAAAAAPAPESAPAVHVDIAEPTAPAPAAPAPEPTPAPAPAPEPTPASQPAPTNPSSML